MLGLKKLNAFFLYICLQAQFTTYPGCIFSKITVHSGPGLYFRRVKLILPEEAQGFMAGGWAVLNCILRC